jgi:hypothetical protein
MLDPRNHTDLTLERETETEKRTDRYLNAMFEAVQLPARVSDLDTGLADVDRDALPHAVGRVRRRGEVGWGGGGKLGVAERGEYEDAFLYGALLRVSALSLGLFYRAGQPGRDGRFCAEVPTFVSFPLSAGRLWATVIWFGARRESTKFYVGSAKWGNFSGHMAKC